MSIAQMADRDAGDELARKHQRAERDDVGDEHDRRHQPGKPVVRAVPRELHEARTLSAR